MSMDREKAILLLNKVQNHSDPKYQFWQVLEWALERDEAARRWARLAQELEQLNDRLSGESQGTGIGCATWSTGDKEEGLPPPINQDARSLLNDAIDQICTEEGKKILRANRPVTITETDGASEQ